jgi:hypothetical protein
MSTQVISKKGKKYPPSRLLSYPADDRAKNHPLAIRHSDLPALVQAAPTACTARDYAATTTGPARHVLCVYGAASVCRRERIGEKRKRLFEPLLSVAKSPQTRDFSVPNAEEIPRLYPESRIEYDKQHE